MKFFFDHTLAVKIARGLHQFAQPEHAVVHLKDEFPPNIEDEHCLSELAKRGEDVVLVTAEVRVERNPHQLAAWRETGQTIFFLKPGWLDMPFWMQTQKLIKRFPDIIAAALSAKRGAAFLVSTSGKIKELRN